MKSPANFMQHGAQQAQRDTYTHTVQECQAPLLQNVTNTAKRSVREIESVCERG